MYPATIVTRSFGPMLYTSILDIGFLLIFLKSFFQDILFLFFVKKCRDSAILKSVYKKLNMHHYETTDPAIS